jgi:hypothetical protein
MRITKGMAQAYAAQDLAADALRALREQLTNEDGTLTLTKDDCQAIATLINALDKAQDRVRIHRGKPLPSAGDAKRGRKLTGKPVGAVIELQELKRIEPPAPDPMPEPIDNVSIEKTPMAAD